MATECVRIDENTQHTHKVENQWAQGDHERSAVPVELQRPDMQLRHLAHRHVVRTLTSTTSNTRLTKIDETLSDRKTNEDNDLDVFELLPSDRTISSAFSALLAAEFFLKIFFYKIFNLE